jgi:hypothetical protein
VNIFVMGKLAGGQITKTDGMMGKLMMSTRGREGLVGATNRNALIGFIVGGLLSVGGVPVAIFGDAPKDTSCKKEFTDELKEPCNTALKTDKDTYTWTVTKAGVYELEVKQPSDAKLKAIPSIEVQDKGGEQLAFNIGAKDTALKVPLEKGTYKLIIEGVDGSHIEGGYRYILGVKFIKALGKDDKIQAGKGKGDDKGTDDEATDDKGSDDDEKPAKKKKGKDDK